MNTRDIVSGLLSFAKLENEHGSAQTSSTVLGAILLIQEQESEIPRLKGIISDQGINLDEWCIDTLEGRTNG